MGRWKMPKLWRAPTPMVRMTAPQITATQKLRSGGALAAREEGRGLDDDTGRGCKEERDIRANPAMQISGFGIARLPTARGRDRSPRRRATSCAYRTRVCGRRPARTAAAPRPRP